MKSKFIFTGAIFAPVCLVVSYVLFMVAGKWSNEYNTLSAYGHFVVWLIASGMVGIIFLCNVIQYIFFGKRCFGSLREYFFEERYSRERKKAMFPFIKRDLLFNEPTGLVLGCVGWGRFKKYVCINPKDKQIANHLSIIGTSSAGKSSGPILTSLIPNFMKDDEIPALTYLVVDCKPELAKLSIKNSQYTKIINPRDRSEWGWDLYWAIDENSTEDEIYDVIKSIVEVLIPEVNEQNAFFVNNARNIMCGVLMFEFVMFKRGFIESIRILLQEDLTEYIKRIKHMVNERSRIYMLLAEFGNTSDKSNALNDIRKTVKEHCDVFIKDDVNWFLDDKVNHRRCSPLDLEIGTSLFLSIPREDLKRYGVLFRLIIAQCMESLSRRKEDDPNLRPVVLILDELVNLGSKIPNYCSNLGFIRSKKVTCVSVFQQYSQLQALYGKEEARTILNIGHILVLSTEDTELGKIFSDKAGEFLEKKIEYKKKGTLLKSRLDTDSVSTTKERRIRVMDDLTSLVPRFEAIAFIQGSTYYRFLKCRYYLEPELKKRAEECREYHRILKEGYLEGNNNEV